MCVKTCKKNQKSMLLRHIYSWLSDPWFISYYLICWFVLDVVRESRVDRRSLRTQRPMPTPITHRRRCLVAAAATVASRWRVRCPAAEKAHAASALPPLHQVAELVCAIEAAEGHRKVRMREGEREGGDASASDGRQQQQQQQRMRVSCQHVRSTPLRPTLKNRTATRNAPSASTRSATR